MKNILKTFLIQLGLFATLLITFGAIYAAWDDVVNSGDPVSSSNWNALVSQIKSQEIPTGFVGSFNLSSCPTGWSPADGTNGTPDLRGEFIRGLDNGRGVDAGRNLASFQSDQFKSHRHQFRAYPFNQGGIASGYYQGFRTYSDSGSSEVTTFSGIQETGGTETRPRNVALLYCIKD